MSDWIKWALLAAALVSLLALIVALPFGSFMDLGELSSAIGSVVTVAGSALSSARSLINFFLLPFGRTVLSGLLIWLIAKWAVMIGIKVVTWAIHFVYK